MAVGVLAATSLVIAACADERGGPAETSAGDAPVRSTTTTEPSRPTAERVTAVPGVLEAPGDQRMVGVAADPDGRVAVAVGTDGDGPALWRAEASGEWARVPLDAEGAVPAGARLSSVAVAGNGSFVVVGEADGGAAAWTSLDGTAWLRAGVDRGPGMAHVARTAAGLLAFAADDGESAVWRSIDGTVWVRAFDARLGVDGSGAGSVVGALDVGTGVVAVVDRRGSGPQLWTSADGLTWSTASTTDPFPAEGEASPAAVIHLDDDRVLAAGAVTAGDGTDAAVWSSDGGRTWEQAPHDEGVLGGDGAQAVTALVVDGGDRLVAVGTDAAEDGSGVDVALWSSGDGQEWIRADPEPLRRPGRQHVVDATVLDGEVVAVGWDDAGGDADAAVWRVGSAPDDGEPADDPARGGAAVPMWVRVDGGALGAPGEQRLEGVTVAEGGFVAVGAVRAPTGEVRRRGSSREVGPVPVGDGDGAVWLSPDGREWARADDDDAMGGHGDQEALGVAAGGGGLVAVGSDGDDAAAWWSADGRSWERTGDPTSLGGPGRQRAAGVAVLAGGFVAVGVDEVDGATDAAAWASLDGRSWRRLDGLAADGDQTLESVAVVGESVVAVGSDGDDAAVWVSGDLRTWERASLGPGRAHGVDTFEGAVVVVGAAPGEGGDRNAAVWRRSGSAWEAVSGGDLAGPDDQRLHAVALSEEIAVAVGRTAFGGGDDAASWVTADAASWVRTPHDEEVLGGDQAQRMADVVVHGGTALAVGWTGTTPEGRDAVVWVADQVDVSGAERNL